MKPIITLSEIDSKLMRIAHQKGVELGVYPSCLNCEHWDGQCKKWKAIPPPGVIVCGCDSYESQLPF